MHRRCEGQWWRCRWCRHYRRPFKRSGRRRPGAHLTCENGHSSLQAGGMCDVCGRRYALQAGEPQMRSGAVESFWSRFCAIDPSVNNLTPYQVWYFGNRREMASQLAELVLSGKKTATASSLNMNELEPENSPQLNGYSV